MACASLSNRLVMDFCHLLNKGVKLLLSGVVWQPEAQETLHRRRHESWMQISCSRPRNRDWKEAGSYKQINDPKLTTKIHLELLQDTRAEALWTAVTAPWPARRRKSVGASETRCLCRRRRKIYLRTWSNLQDERVKIHKWGMGRVSVGSS